MNLKKYIKKALIILVCAFVLGLIAIYVANNTISSKSKPYIYSSTNDITNSEVILVLGTSKYMKGGHLNPYFTKRISAANELYIAGKAKAFILSGDNSREEYNEPEDMRTMLIEAGVPDSIIHLDYAGFRTLDSVVRLNKIFNQNKFIIVSQPFHTERAIYIARQMDLDAYGYNAKDVNSKYGFKTQVREKFARVKVFIDFLLNKQPKFLGDPIDIE